MSESADDIHPDMQGLFEIASGQMGHFTTAQAREQGSRGNLISYHVKTGRFIRIHRGVYRFRDYPSSPREEVMAAWLAVGKEKAVVSHESALDLLELGDLIPAHTHLTVPRTLRNLPRLENVNIHTTIRPLDSTDVMQWEGMMITAPARAIVDIADAAHDPIQVNHAARDAFREGWVTSSQLERVARPRNRRVRDLISGVVSGYAK